MTTFNKLVAISVAALALSGCAKTTPPNTTHTKSLPQHEARVLHDSSVIPSENGVKQQTTNKHGSTTNGMGTSVYSTIGSSGLHSNGFSAHLESRLSGLGISDVRVFVFDDTVVLATEKLTTSGVKYDNMQQKLLSQTEGMSSKGYSPDSGLGGVSGLDNSKHDNLSLAADHIKSLIGSEVKVHTVTGTRAVQAIEHIRKDALAKDFSPDKVASDIRELLRLVKAGSGNTK